MNGMLRFLLRELLPPLLLAVIVGVGWELCVRIFSIPKYLLPSPTEIGRAVSANFADLAAAMQYTATAAGAGLLTSCLLGGCVAMLFSQSAPLRRAGYPYAIFLQTVPIVAIAPLVVIWCGNGITAVIIVSAIISLFPIIASTTSGLIGVPRELVDVFRLSQASWWQILLKLRIPHAVPYFLTGVRTSAGLAVIGSIVGEFFVGHSSSQKGLGYWIMVYTSRLETAKLFAAVLASTLLGVITFTLILWLERLVFSKWSTSGGEREASI